MDDNGWSVVLGSRHAVVEQAVVALVYGLSGGAEDRAQGFSF